MLKKIISLLLIVLLLNSLVGCGGNNVNPVIPDDEEDISLDDIILAYDSDPTGNVLVFAVKDNGESIIALGEKNADGTPKKITGITYTAENDESLFIELDNDGLPFSLTDLNGTKVIYSNYTDTTVEISIYDNEDNLISGPETVELDSQMMTQIKQLSQLERSSIRGNFQVGETLKTVGFIVGLAVGAVVVVTASPAIAAAAAVSMLVSTVIYASENVLASQANIIYKGWTCTGWDCAGVVISGIGNFITINEENKVLDTIDGFSNAMNNEKWEEAKTYCVPNSVAYTSVEEYKSLFDQLYDMCDQFTYQCSGAAINPEIEVVEGVSEEMVTVTFNDSSGSCIMTCVIGTEDFTIDASASGSEKYFLEKIGGVWLIFYFEGIYEIEDELDQITHNDEEEIESICSKVVSALNNKNWNEARSYCINGSEAYNQVSELEDAINNVENWYGPGNLNINTNINNIVVNGNYATVYGYFNSTFTAGSYFDENSGSITGYLEKISSSWKIYEGLIPNL